MSICPDQLPAATTTSRAVIGVSFSSWISTTSSWLSIRWTRAGTRMRAPCLIAAAASAPDSSAADDKPVRFDEQRAGDVGRQLRLGFFRGLRIQQLAVESRAARVVGNLLEVAERLVGGDDLQRAGAAIADADSSVARHAIDERVVHLEAAGGQRQKRPAKALEVRHEHARRRLGRAKAGPPAIDQRHRRPPGHELVGDGLALSPRPRRRRRHNLALSCLSSHAGPCSLGRTIEVSEGDIGRPQLARKTRFFTIFAVSRWVRALLLHVTRSSVPWKSIRAALGAIAVIGLAAAGGGAYLAVLHNGSDSAQPVPMYAASTGQCGHGDREQHHERPGGSRRAGASGTGCRAEAATRSDRAGAGPCAHRSPGPGAIASAVARTVSARAHVAELRRQQPLGARLHAAQRADGSAGLTCYRAGREHDGRTRAGRARSRHGRCTTSS